MTTHFTGPVLNKDNSKGSREWYKNAPMHTDPDYITYYNDFLHDNFDEDAADWSTNVVDSGGDGAESFGLASDELNGALAIATNDAENDSYAVEQKNETYQLESGKRLWYETRLKIDDATESDLFAGLTITQSTANPTGSTDRIGFRLDDGDANIDVISRKDSTSTKEDSGKDASDDTYVTLGFYWDGKNKAEFYVDRDKVATHNTSDDNIPDDEQLGLGLEVLTGDANARTVTVDYIHCTKER